MKIGMDLIKKMNLKTSRELKRFLDKRNPEEFTPEAFSAMQYILEAREKSVIVSVLFHDSQKPLSSWPLTDYISLLSNNGLLSIDSILSPVYAHVEITGGYYSYLRGDRDARGGTALLFKPPEKISLDGKYLFNYELAYVLIEGSSQMDRPVISIFGFEEYVRIILTEIFLKQLKFPNYIENPFPRCIREDFGMAANYWAPEHMRYRFPVRIIGDIETSRKIEFTGNPI